MVKADGWITRVARTKMGQVAASMVGQHYLKGGKGARPGKQDGAPCRRGQVTLSKSTDPAAPAFLAGASALEGLVYICGGRYAKVGRAVAANSENVRVFLKDQSTATSYYTAAGLTPRRVIEAADEAIPQPLVWGECCDGWRHFDCLGLVDYAFAFASAVTDMNTRTVAQWASPANTVKAQHMADSEEVLDGDLVSVKGKTGNYHHIGIIYLMDGQPFVAQAQETKIGVTTGTVYDSAKWTGGRWRLPDSMFLPDWSVNEMMPDTDCKPSVMAKSQMQLP